MLKQLQLSDTYDGYFIWLQQTLLHINVASSQPCPRSNENISSVVALLWSCVPDIFSAFVQIGALCLLSGVSLPLRVPFVSRFRIGKTIALLLWTMCPIKPTR